MSATLPAFSIVSHILCHFPLVLLVSFAGFNTDKEVMK